MLSDGHDKGRQLFAVVSASLFSVLVTLVIFLLTEVQFKQDRHLMVVVIVYLLEAFLALLSGVYLSAYVFDLRSLLATSQAEEAVRRAVPRYVTFSRRSDTLLLGQSGDADLIWEFELSSRSEDAITELTFPIFAETLESTQPWTSIRIDSIEVNGQSQQVKDAYRHVERRLPPDDARYLVEYGLLRVPVELERGRDKCDIRVRVHFVGVFPKSDTLETFFVDIPYLTESLSVVIRSKAGAVRRSPLAERTLSAMSEVMEVPDPVESGHQERFCRQDGLMLTWRTNDPKLG